MPPVELPDFKVPGGRHWETAALGAALTYQGVVDPFTGRPPSEAMILGLGGGIVPGYSFCPSTLDRASGVLVTGRTHLIATTPIFAERVASRLGGKIHVSETAGEKKALANLAAALADGKPALVWAQKTMLPYLHLGWRDGCQWFMHVVCVHSLDEAGGDVRVAEAAPTSLSVEGTAFAAARADVCSFKNRVVTLDLPTKLTKAAYADAVRAGLADYIDASRRPKMKTFSLIGLREWAKMLTNDKNARGWRRAYSGGELYRALRDAFDSIETWGNGGGNFRGMYAEFLDEAAIVTKTPALSEAAAAHHELATEWTVLADAFLPDRVAPFKKTKTLLRKRRDLFESKGAGADKQLAKITDELAALEIAVLADFPLTDAHAADLLADVQARLGALLNKEDAALDALEAIVG